MGSLLPFQQRGRQASWPTFVVLLDLRRAQSDRRPPLFVGSVSDRDGGAGFGLDPLGSMPRSGGGVNSLIVPCRIGSRQDKPGTIWNRLPDCGN